MKHAHTGQGKQTPEYKAWASIVQRTTNPECPSWPRYGGRGIKICQRWRESFEAFLTDVGYRPSPKHSIGRTLNDGHYEPGNVTWETPSQQARNKSDNNNLTFLGKTRTIAEWAERTGISRQTISARVNKLGWSVDRALTTPVSKGASRGGKARKKKRRRS